MYCYLGVSPYGHWDLLPEEYKFVLTCDIYFLQYVAFGGTLTVVLYYQCVTNGVLVADKLFLEESLNAICCFLILPAILFFTPVFSILQIYQEFSQV